MTKINKIIRAMREEAEKLGGNVVGGHGELIGPFDPYGLERGVEMKPLYWEWEVVFKIRVPVR